jgi:hypothetical protein
LPEDPQFAGALQRISSLTSGGLQCTLSLMSSLESILDDYLSMALPDPDMLSAVAANVESMQSILMEGHTKRNREVQKMLGELVDELSDAAAELNSRVVACIRGTALGSVTEPVLHR